MTTDGVTYNNNNDLTYSKNIRHSTHTVTHSSSSLSSTPCTNLRRITECNDLMQHSNQLLGTDSTHTFINPSTTHISMYDSNICSNQSRRDTGSTLNNYNHMHAGNSNRTTATTVTEFTVDSVDTQSVHQLQTPVHQQRSNANQSSTLNSPTRTHTHRPPSINISHQHTNTPSVTYSRVRVIPAQSVNNTPLIKAMTGDLRRPSLRAGLDSNHKPYNELLFPIQYNDDSRTISNDNTSDVACISPQSTQSNSCANNNITNDAIDLNSYIYHSNPRLIELRDEIQPAFRADGEVDTNYIDRKQYARRTFIQNACYVFAVVYGAFEILYIITPDYNINHDWVPLLLRGIATLGVVIYATVILRMKQLIEQELLEGSATGVMTVCGIILIVIELLRTQSADSVTNDALVLSLILIYSFTDVVLRIKFVYACIQALVLFSLYNILMLTTSTQTIQNVLLCDAYMVLMLSGLLLLCHDSEVYRRDDFANKRHLFMERRKAEALMRTMLPQQILTEYLDGRMAQISAIATIGYCEIKILTQSQLNKNNILYVQPSPVEIMQKLHDTFKRIDGIINMFAIRGVNKIETVSKTYLLCGGLLQDVDDHASAMIETALEITNMIKRNTRPNQRLPILVRFGISTGHVVGGIIGAQRRYFRVFGDTVNVAARMCMNTSIGTIQISQQCYDSLSEFQRSTIKAVISEPRELSIKGKGVMSCYVVDTRDDWIPQFGKSVQFRGNLADKHNDKPLLNKSFVYHTLINHTSLHPLALTYHGKHNQQMETQFQCNYTQTFVNSIKKVNVVFIGWLLCCCSYVLARHYTGTSNITNVSVPILCGLILGVMIGINCLLYTQYARSHLQSILTAGIMALSAWVVCTLGFWGLDGPMNPTYSMFTVILYSCLLMRLQFRYATPVICCTVVAYLVTLMVSHRPWYDITLVMINIVVCTITGIVTMARFEYRIRLNFLLKYALEQEQIHMDEFLSNLLPTFVVDVLRKRNGRPVLLPGQNEYTSDNRHGLAHPNDQLSSRFSMKFKQCTVFESDIVGYTAMVGNWSADRTLNMLNSIFNLFDECASLCRVEKIETIGDAFMCVVFDGQPDPVLNFSLLIQSVLYERNKQSAVEEQVHIRIGVSTGSCFGGVIGTKIPRFHLFGDAHDHAILIEQNGRADECIVSSTTYDMTQSRYNYELSNNTDTNEIMYILRSQKHDTPQHITPIINHHTKNIESVLKNTNQSQHNSVSSHTVVSG